MRYISGSSGSVATRAVLLSAVITSSVTYGGLGQRPDIRQSLGLDSVAFVILQQHINGSRAVRVRVGLADWRLARPVLDASGFTYEGRGVPSNQGPLSIGDADEIWIQGHAMVPGAKYGALTLGIPSVIFGVALMLPCRGEPADAAFCDQSMGAVAALVGIGVALGAVVGGVIGLTQSHWKTVYERSRIAPSLHACRFIATPRLCVGAALVF